jgi:hypothetical protein
MRTLEEIMSSIKQKLEVQRQAPTTAALAVAPKALVAPLPLWPEEARACPSCVLRSALFGVVQRGRRRYLKRQIMAAWLDTTIRYTGIRLDQADLDVWLTALHLSLGTRVICSERAFLRALGRATKNVEWLKEALTRLTACAVEITYRGKTYWGPLIEKGCRDEETGQFLILLNPELVNLFEDVTWQEWEIRVATGLHCRATLLVIRLPLTIRTGLAWSACGNCAGQKQVNSGSSGSRSRKRCENFRRPV